MRANANLIYAIALAAIILVGLVARMIPATHMLFYEPDNFYYYSILQQSTSGFLPHTSIYNNAPVAESAGLYFLPAMFMGYLSFTPLQAMYLTTAIATILILVLTYVFASMIINKTQALVATIFVALLPASLARTIITEFRGDTFAPIFTLLMLILLLKALKENDRTWASGAGLIAALSLFFWTGGVLTIAVLFFVAIGILFYNIKKTPTKQEYVIIITMATAGLGIIPLSIGIPQSTNPLGIAVALLCFAVFSYFYLKINKTLRIIYRITTLLIIGVYLFSIFLAEIVLQASTASSSQIAELAPPTLTYLLGSYGILLFTTPAVGLLFYIMPLGAIGITLLLTILMFRKGMNEERILLSAYLFVMVAVNAFYIRFNALAAVPIAILSAYTLFHLFKFIDEKLSNKPIVALFTILVLSIIIIFMAFVALHDVSTIQPGEQVNASMLQSMAWLKNNTPANSTIFALWPDGSVIEAMANRRVFSDSVAIQPAGLIQWKYYIEDNLSAFPTNTTPDYLYTREFYMHALIGICYGVDNYSLMNCTQALYPNGTIKPTSIPQFMHTNLYKLQKGSCNIVGCTLSANSTTLKLVYDDGVDKIYKVIK